MLRVSRDRPLERFACDRALPASITSSVPGGLQAEQDVKGADRAARRVIVLLVVISGIWAGPEPRLAELRSILQD